MFFAFLTLQFISCDNEPLTGEFPQEDNNAEIGQFIATIEGEQFVAENIIANLTSENELIISGSKINGQQILLSISNATVGTYNLGTGLNMGTYYDGSGNMLPYSSAQAIGGSGQLIISDIDTAAKTVSGTFNINGYRIKLDANGDPVLDGNGEPVLENIEITAGAFNTIDYTEEHILVNSDDEFFAKVDGVGFVADSISVSEPIVGNVKMLKVEALNSDGALMRIDIPKSLGLGTFDMVNISDGTKLIALYNAGGGAENLTSNPGTITITEIDLEEGILKATFAFIGNDPLGQVVDVVQVTEGTFTAHFEGVPGGNNIFRASVDDADYNPDSTEIVITTDVVNQYPTLTISSTKEDQRMVLTFPATISVGVFNMATEVVNGDEIVGSYTPIVGTSITYISSPGSLRIINYDIQNGIIEGTFTFKAKDITGEDPSIYNVNEGSFYIELP